MFSEEYGREIAAAFDEKMTMLKEAGSKIRGQVQAYEEDTAMALQYLYVAMPVSDALDYEVELFADYARHGVYLWKEGPFAGRVPEKLFANYVLHHRINNEDLSSCRGFFYEELAGRISGMNMKESALNANYWCAEEATYQTTDGRTASPMTVYRSAFGRCGEESTMAVSVFRSIGIPARQVYAPLWSHCDDNHAWVEVWCDGDWYFLGACEPEEIMNKGWFTNASSRAMMIHSRWFDAVQPEESVVGKKGISTVINHLERYALTKSLTVKVLKEDETPAAGAKISFEVLNYGEFGNVASGTAGEDGCFTVTTGLGSLHVFAYLNGKCASLLVNARNEDEAVLHLSKEIGQMDVWESMEVIAPKDAPVNADQPTKEQKEAGEQKAKTAASKRLNKVESFYQASLVDAVLETAKASEEDAAYIRQTAEAARGNLDELLAFLQWNPEENAKEEGQGQEPREAETCMVNAGKPNDGLDSCSVSELWSWKIELLKQLTVKDYRDMKAEVLIAHLASSISYRNNVPKEIYAPYILNPRIELERMTAYKQEILKQLTAEQVHAFVAAPAKIASYVKEAVHAMPEQEYGTLITAPVTCLTYGIGSLHSQKVLCAAIGRALGIPSRLNVVDGALEYYIDGSFQGVEEQTDNRDAKVIFEGEDRDWTYMQNWTLGRWSGEEFVTLNLQEEFGASVMGEIPLESGTYRILTANRLPNGNIFANQYHFCLQTGECRSLVLSLVEAQLSDMLEENQILDFALKNEKKEPVMASTLDAEHKALMIWLEESKEPTEHILNELYERAEEFNQLDARIYFIIKNQTALEDPTLKRTLSVLQGVEFLYDDFGSNVQTLGRRMYVDPDKLPLILVVKQGLLGLYAASGYNVGTADMLLRILKEV